MNEKYKPGKGFMISEGLIIALMVVEMSKSIDNIPSAIFFIIFSLAIGYAISHSCWKNTIRELVVYNEHFALKEGRKLITLKEYKKFSINRNNRYNIL